MLRITSSTKQIFPCKVWGKRVEKKMMFEGNQLQLESLICYFVHYILQNESK